MSTNAGPPPARNKLGRAVEIGGVALSTLVAVGVSVVFLAFTGASRTRLAPPHQSSGSASPIRHNRHPELRTATQIHRTPGYDPSTSRPWSVRAWSSKEEK